MSDGDTVLIGTRAGVGRITLNAPDRLNAVDPQMLADLADAIHRLDIDPQVRVIVLAGAGRGFCSGADIKGDSDSSALPAPIADGAVPLLLEAQEQIASLHERINRLRKPVIAAVNGFALGGGCELAMMCDIIYAADTAQFGQPEVKLGILPGAAVTRQHGCARLWTGSAGDAAQSWSDHRCSRVLPPTPTAPRSLR